MRDQDLSRVVSHALRHEPWLYELELDEEGWVPVDQLLAALREKGGDWAAIDRDALERMIAGGTKRRHELHGDRIRALYGHSLRGCSRDRAGALGSVGADGLLRMSRQFVHLGRP